ncbi:hypothetical protein [Myxococcus sp. AM011]|uniref:hypothetical protein n=1 Tax=Myxococcus sp. AM011 TaxID=2745200 RepID=UPI0026E58FBE|nr:hypothetical protein [Myxococcus sp. AM011]
MGVAYPGFHTFGYGFLTMLQQRLGVPCSQRELELINTLYQQRKQHAGNATRQAELDQAFQHLVALQVTQAEAILSGGSTPTTVPLTNPSFESGMTGWSTWSPNGTEWAAFIETYNGARSGAYHRRHAGAGLPHAGPGPERRQLHPHGVRRSAQAVRHGACPGLPTWRPG